ncbi:ubiquitin carboxyl-terminal hydrolase MINDY-1 isoform X2 [Parasteatoda tepidariorum]|uniref:ubiquitin carboxyl-terminal hydrolase MINDY-1 isoform X2 n=1 Tax=Parasteatoda tepidariorum TaxID=114398 RepID=UPI001C71D943|nr:ubiquitin carboxyl-terminal hydrolase MINDY-1 isoform X2 [Parasteatoda tepidariorum]
MAATVEEQMSSMDEGDSEMTTQDESTEIPCEKGQCPTLTDVSDSKMSSSSIESKSNMETASPVKDKISDSNDFIYQVKWISRNGVKSPIITQNENGPCPLIAITNVLIMKGRITIPSLADFVSTENLMEYLGNCILESIPTNIPEGTQLNFEQNMHDAMAVLPKLQTGLDVNVKFTGISDFEYTSECIIFDLLRIPLYHGWLIDPQSEEIVRAVGKCSYNQLVEKIINLKFSSDPDQITEALVAEHFLEKSASQLTYHGLYELTSKLKEDELCVLFRNNHFSSLVKHNNCLYQLVTDQGFLNENVVWETLDNIEGDGQFVDSSFVLVPPKCADVPLPLNIPEEKQIDQDEELALRLQEEEMNEEDNHRPTASAPQSNNQSRNNSNNRSRDCIIL